MARSESYVDLGLEFDDIDCMEVTKLAEPVDSVNPAFARMRLAPGDGEQSQTQLGTIARGSHLTDRDQTRDESPHPWPQKFDVLGVEVSATSYDELVNLLIAAAKRRDTALVNFVTVHGVATGATDAGFRYRINAFDVTAPDGQPIRWALNKLHNAQLQDRVYGPETMLRLCARAATEKLSVYFYGSSPEVLAALESKLLQQFPTLHIAGTESPPFRPLTEQENDAAVERINSSGAQLVFIGLGAPRQEIFAHENRHKIKAVQLCVGAAFDFHAGTKKIAPAWMQKRGLEWLFRLTQEPGRLWKRYLITNSIFVYLMARRLLTGR